MMQCKKESYAHLAHMTLDKFQIKPLGGITGHTALAHSSPTQKIYERQQYYRT